MLAERYSSVNGDVNKTIYMEVDQSNDKRLFWASIEARISWKLQWNERTLYSLNTTACSIKPRSSLFPHEFLGDDGGLRYA